MGRERAFEPPVGQRRPSPQAVPKCRGGGTGRGSQHYFAPVAMGSILPPCELPDLDAWVPSGEQSRGYELRGRAVALGRPRLGSRGLGSTSDALSRCIVRIFGGACVIRQLMPSMYVTEGYGPSLTTSGSTSGGHMIPSCSGASARWRPRHAHAHRAVEEWEPPLSIPAISELLPPDPS